MLTSMWLKEWMKSLLYKQGSIEQYRGDFTFMLIILRLCWKFVCTFGVPILTRRIRAKIALQIS